MKYQKLENQEANWKWIYLIRKHREGEKITRYEEKSLEEIENELSYSKEDIEEAYKEVTSLKEEGLLFTEDIYEDYIKEVKSRKT